MAANALRDLLLAIQVKVDKTAITQTDKAFDQATKSARFFENGMYKALEPLKKIGAELEANTRKARALSKTFASTGFTMPKRPPEAQGVHDQRKLRAVLGMKDFVNDGVSPKPPRPGEFAGKLVAPNIDDFLDKRSTLRKAFDGLRDNAKSALDVAGGYVERFNARFDGTIRAIFSAQTALTGLAVVIAGTAIVNFVGDVVKAGAELHTMSQRTRLSVETLQVWRDVAAGVNADSSAVTGAFQRLSAAIAAAGRGSKSQVQAFKDLGVQFKDRTVEEVLIDTGTALAALDDDAKASALAVKLLGPAGAALVPAFQDGSAAVRKLTAELRENVVMTAEEAKRLEEVGSAVERGEKKWKALKTRAIVLLLPVLEAVTSAFEKASKWILRMSKETSSLQTIFLAITGGGLFRLVTMLGVWITRVGGARAALVALGSGLQTAASFAFRFIAPLLLIEDFLTFLAGGKSLFGRAFEEIFGPGGAQKVREGILAVLNEVQAVLGGTLISALKAIGDSDFFKGVAKGAAEAILAVLHAIGLALADNEQKAEAMAKALKKNLQALGIAPSDEKLAAVERSKEEQVTAVREGRTNPQAPTEGPGWFSRALGSIVGVDHKAIRERAEARAGAVMSEGVVPTPAAPPQPKGSVTLTDNRKIEVNVGANSAPGATGRAVGGAVDGALTKDRRQTLNAL